MLLDDLIQLADKMDLEGQYGKANQITAIIKKIAQNKVQQGAKQASDFRQIFKQAVELSVKERQDVVNRLAQYLRVQKEMLESLEDKQLDRLRKMKNISLARALVFKWAKNNKAQNKTVLKEDVNMPKGLTKEDIPSSNPFE